MEPQMNADERGLKSQFRHFIFLICVHLRSSAVPILILLFIQGCAHQASPRSVVSFDSNWRFAVGDPKDAASPQFDDSSWRKLDVPHDWSIEGEFERSAPAGGAGAVVAGLLVGASSERTTAVTSRTAIRANMHFFM